VQATGNQFSDRSFAGTSDTHQNYDYHPATDIRLYLHIALNYAGKLKGRVESLHSLHARGEVR
jgi:hypothetical protein